MEIVYITDHNLYPYLLPSIMSFIEHNDVKKIYILAEDEKLPYELPDICEVIKITPTDWCREDGKNFNNRWTPFCLCKVVISKILKNVDKILYVDVDCICTDNIQEMYDTELGTNYVAAVEEKYKQDYFNAGVMLLNLKQIREDKADQWMQNYINSVRLKCPDQDAFNDVARQRKLCLDIRYNETDFTGKTDAPAIIHYAAYNTWWKRYTPRYEYYGKYKEYEREYPPNQ